MSGKRRVLVTMFVFSALIHLILAIAWSAHQLNKVQSMVNVESRIFTVIKPPEVTRTHQPTPIQNMPMMEPIIARHFQRENRASELATKVTPSSAAAIVPNLQPPIEPDSLVEAINTRVSPFQSAIDPKKAWINVAESVNYSLLNGISIDISGGEFRLQDGLDKRVQAKGNLTIEYPLSAAILGKETKIYVLLLIDEKGNKSRMQIVRGDPDFDNAVLQSLEKVEFFPAMLKREPVRSLMLLEFEFRRGPPDIEAF